MTKLCLFRENVDDEVTLIRSVHMDGMVVTGQEADYNRLLDVPSGKVSMCNRGELT